MHVYHFQLGTQTLKFSRLNFFLKISFNFLKHEIDKNANKRTLILLQTIWKSISLCLVFKKKTWLETIWMVIGCSYIECWIGLKEFKDLVKDKWTNEIHM